MSLHTSPRPRSARPSARTRHRRQRGLSLAEVLVAVALVAGALAPAVEAVSTALPGARIHADLAQAAMAPLHGRMEELLARPYPALLRAAGSGGTPCGSAGTAIAAYNPAATLAFPLPAAAPPGPGYTDVDFQVYINCVAPVAPVAGQPQLPGDVTADAGLLRVRVVATAGGATLTAYKARIGVWE